MSESSQPPHHSPQKLRRSRKPAVKKKSKDLSQLRRYGLNLFLIAVAAAATFFIINPGERAIIISLTGEATTEPDLIVRASAILILISAFMLIGWRWQKSFINNKRYWAVACPSCGHEEIKRYPRTTIDHLVNRIGIPIRRYICAQCHWIGPRVDQHRL